MNHVYKYLPPDRVTYLDDELLRYTQPAALNDPFECLPVITHRQAIDVFKSDLGSHEENLLLAEKRQIIEGIEGNPVVVHNYLQKNIGERFNLDIGIFSVSSRWNSVLMWSHYAASHAGFCVGFLRTAPVFMSLQNESLLRPVSYSSERASLSTKSSQSIDEEVLYTKSIDWSYEKEERAIGRLKSENLHPTIPDCYLSKVPHDAIGELIVGVNTGSELKAKVVSLARRLGCPVYRTIISERTFDVEREIL
ncbi:DUF2971 domain-containing protein [Methylobacter sp. Wu8]|uniref:DUF2971 domain-containing protein n=1 Tax=Methylobacter sp. Wu8 TaxID=3118457 RepID=UPI002F31787E